ncbi:MAG: AAA family ATPase [Saprospiraceae bacterium]|nr:AAA family ATPase [Saprospiraceae bacterium]
MELIDNAFKQLEKVIEEIKTYDNSIFSEQDSRIKIIDRILIEVLGYRFEDILTEARAGIGFLDYKIIIDNLPKLAIEAKKDGLDFNIDQSYSGRAFNLNGPVFKDKTVQEGLDQSIYYSAHNGIELSCLTNGRTWIVFRSNRLGDGKQVLDGKGFVFSTLESVQHEFKLFYELLSPEGISDLRFRALFQEVEGAEIRKKDFAKSIKDEYSLKVIPKKQHALDFDRVMNEFFSKLTGDSDPDLLKECFVETKESKVADKELLRISEDLIRRVHSLETEQAELLTEIIEKVRTTNRHEFVILIGSKGAGKSTFIQRFFENVIQQDLREQCIVIRIDLGLSDGNLSTIVDWLNTTLLEECERVLYNGKPSFEEIQGMFYFEYDRLRTGNWNKLYERDKDQFKIDFGKHIEERRETRPSEYIKRMIGDITKSRLKVPCLVFDNTDHYSIEFQETVFQYARSIYEREICLVIVPITDKTSWQLSQQGAIQSFENEVLYLPMPKPKKIIEKRIEFIQKRITTTGIEKGRYFLDRGIKLEISNIGEFVKFLQSIFLSDEYVAKWIGHFANYDIRRCLELTKDIIASPHLSLDELLKTYITGHSEENDRKYEIKPYKIKNALIKRVYTSYPINNHPFIQNLFYLTGNLNTSPILSLRALQVLMDRRNERSKEDNYIKVDQILDYFNAMGIDRSITSKHLDLLLKKV